MKAQLLALILLASCTQRAEITRDNFGLRVEKVHMDISQLSEITWWIGAKRKEDQVTQSISFLLDLPKLSEEDLEYLKKERGVDSWLVRVIQVKRGKSQDLGSLVAPFFPKRHGRSSSRSSTAIAGIKIYYAAAYASERMRALPCPSFNHDKRVDEMSVKGETGPFEITVGASQSYREKAQSVQLTPSSFNGGHSLQGEYHLEIAPYSMQKQALQGPFRRLPMYVEVGPEKTIKVPSCQGLYPEFQ